MQTTYCLPETLQRNMCGGKDVNRKARAEYVSIDQYIRQRMHREQAVLKRENFRAFAFQLAYCAKLLQICI